MYWTNSKKTYSCHPFSYRIYIHSAISAHTTYVYPSIQFWIHTYIHTYIHTHIHLYIHIHAGNIIYAHQFLRNCKALRNIIVVCVRSNWAQQQPLLESEKEGRHVCTVYVCMYVICMLYVCMYAYLTRTYIHLPDCSHYDQHVCVYVYMYRSGWRIV
jgi:hypothetical protein